MVGGLPSGAPGEASARSSIVTLINSCVGVGVLSLPYAFRAAGWAGGLGLLAFVAVTEAFTLYVLSRYAEHTDSGTYSAVVHRMLGKRASLFLAGVLLVYLFGSCIAYLIIFADCLHPIVLGIFGHHWFTHRNVVLPGLSAITMFPLCLPRTLDAIVGISAVALYGIVAMVGIVTWRNVEAIAVEDQPWAEVKPFNWSLDFLAAIPIVIFGMQCHCQVITVFNELTDHPRVLSSILPAPSARLVVREEEEEDEEEEAGIPESDRLERRRSHQSKKLRGMRRVVFTAIGLTAVGYAAIGLTGYLAFPHTAMSNILNNFSRNDKLMQLCRGLVGLMKIVSYPINHHPARSATADVIRQLTGRVIGGSTLFHAGHAVVFYLVTLSVAMTVTDLGAVFKVVGGTNGAFLIFGLPGAMLMKYAHDKAVASKVAADAVRPLLSAEGTEEQRPYRLLTSKLWWAGIGLVTLCMLVLTLTIISMVYPMKPSSP